jgi:integrase
MRKLTKRKEGRYRLIVRVYDATTGKNKPLPVYGYTIPEVEARSAELTHKRNVGDITNPGKLTVAGYLDAWLKSYKGKLAEYTINAYENYIDKHISKDGLGNILLLKLMPMHIESFYNNEREKGFSEKTILQEHHILHRAFKFAVRNNLLSKNICDLVDAPSSDDFLIKIYDEDKFNKLLYYVAGTKDELPILLAGMCGLRRSEVFGLNWLDVNIDTGNISVNKVAVYSKKEKAWILKDKPKNKSSKRTFAIPSEILPIFKQRKGIGLVCCNDDGSIVSGGTYSHRFAWLLKKLDLPHIRFHDLRHFNATMMLKYGVSDKEAAGRLGHATPNTLRTTYQHILDSMKTDGANKLNSVIKKNPSEVQIGVQ